MAYQTAVVVLLAVVVLMAVAVLMTSCCGLVLDQDLQLDPGRRDGSLHLKVKGLLAVGFGFS